MNLYTTYTESEIEIIKSLSSEVQNIAHSKLLEVAEHIFILQDIPENILLKILKDIQIIKYKTGEIIIEDGEIGEEIYYIFFGKVAVKKKNRKISILEKGTVFGEMAGILKQRRSASIIAEQDDTTILSFKLNNNLMKSDLSYYFAIIYKNLSISLAKKILENNKKF